MPVTKTAKRALRGSANKTIINKLITSKLEAAIRNAKKSKTQATVQKAVSLADRASKNNVIHKNKAARIKSQLAKLMPKLEAKTKTPVKKSAKK